MKWRYISTVLFLGSVLYTQSLLAETTTVSAPANNSGASLTTSASLDFQINMGKFIFFRLGNSAYPTASSTVSTVSFNANYTIPAGAITPSNGSNQAVNWNNTAPTLTTTGSAALPVEIRSNAGTVSLRASVNTPLANGSHTIPFSRINISSNNSSLPAPLVPDSGAGTSVNVVGNSFAGLVTNQSATWTFTYTNNTPLTAGTYQGQLLFTASAP
ncbi:hypothetical protein [Thiolinea disciformis]|uniref:hypothetical protein n=1 Tax=Thiolinea disciformis TaxID=125614 RepID=UPI000372171C|nr:hypothetical protein [Thiolinea disciformis]